MTATESTQPEVTQGLTLQDYVRILRQYGIGILICIGAGLLIAFAWTRITTPVYESTSTGLVAIRQPGQDGIGSALAADSLAKSKATSYASIAQSQAVAERVIRKLDLDTSFGALLGRVSVSHPLDTQEIRVTARASKPDEAQQLANAWVTALADQIAEVEQQGSSSQVIQQPDGTQITQETTPQMTIAVDALGNAPLPTAPSSPNVRLALLVGLLLGALAGFGYAIIRNQFDRRIRSVTEVERRFGVSTVGTVPIDTENNGDRRLVVGLSSPSTNERAIAESFREIRTNLAFVDVDNPPRSIVVTSSVPSEGKTTMIANLAAAIAISGQKVVVIDGDLRRPSVTKVFGLEKGAGLADVLARRVDLEDVLQTWVGSENLKILAAGRHVPNPSEIVGSRSMKQVIDRLAEDHLVLVDAPPLLPVTDAALLSRQTEGVLVVVKAGSTTFDELGHSLGALDRVSANLLGVILNRVPSTGPNARQYGYYGRSYDYRSDEAKKSDDAQKSGEAKVSGKRKLPSLGHRTEEEPRVLNVPDDDYAPAPIGRRVKL